MSKKPSYWNSAIKYLSNKDNLLPYCELEDLVKNPQGIIVLSGSVNSLSGYLYLKNKVQEIKKNKIKEFILQKSS